MSAIVTGPWNRSQIDSFLQDSTFPLRLACVGDDGVPRVVSVWYGYDGHRLRCVSHRSSKLISLLKGSDRVGFELAPNEPPYYGVRGQGIAQLDTAADGTVLTELMQRYLGRTESKLGNWLLSRADDEILITIEATRLFSWDYRDRMSQAQKTD